MVFSLINQRGTLIIAKHDGSCIQKEKISKPLDEEGSHLRGKGMHKIYSRL